MCNIAAVLPDGRVLHTEAAMEGEIAKEAAGNGGFGYDPILWLPEYGKTSAELTGCLKAVFPCLDECHRWRESVPVQQGFRLSH